MKKLDEVRPIISNIVSTSNLHNKVDVKKFVKFGWGTYDDTIYGGRCGYVKTPEMQGRVIVFPSGKMISVGARSARKSFEQLNQAKFCLLRGKLIPDVRLEQKIQNIVGTLTLENNLRINRIVAKLQGAIYEPEQFPGIILKSVRSLSYLIFASGKIVISGAKSEEELMEASLEIQGKIKSLNRSI